MLRRDAGKSVSIQRGFRNRDFFHAGRGLLPFLAVMLLAAPQLAMAQGGLAVTVNPRTLEVTEQGTAGPYTVVLNDEPSANVVITVVGAPTSGADITVDRTSLTFRAPSTPGGTDGDWDTAQTVQVTANDDADAVSETITITHTAKVGTGDAIALSNASVRVTAKDNDPRRVTLSTNAVTVGEASNTAGTYTVVLTTEPTATVTVDIAGASGEITVSPSRLFFQPGNYNNPQTVNVYAGEDFDAEIDKVTLTHTVQGGDYTGVQANSETARTDGRVDSTVVVTVTENDSRGVTVAPTSLNIAAGASGAFSIMLKSQPKGSVRITVTENSVNLSLSRTSVSFSSSNWNRPQAVTVRVPSNATAGDVDLETAIDKSSSSRDKGYDFNHASDTETNSFLVTNVTATVAASTSAVKLSRSSMTIDEGGTAKYTVRLAANPGEGVSRDVTVNLPTGFSMRPTSLASFSGPDSQGEGATWNTAQTVTVTAPNDENAVQEAVTITHTIGGSIVTGGVLPVTVRESDTRGVTITPTSLEVTEGGTARYNIVLDSQPVGGSENAGENRVTVTVGGASGDVTVSPSQLLFHGGNWTTAQEVEVTAATDDDGVTDAPVTLRHTVRGSDYDRTTAANVRVTIKEIHTRGIIVDTTLAADEDPDVATSSLTVGEGKTGMYSVRLESQPTGTVTVMVLGASGDVTVKPSRLIFTTSTWADEQTVEVKAGQDEDAEQDAAVTLTHSASGGGYSGVTGGAVTVTVTEDDAARKRVIVTPNALTLNEGGPAQRYTVVLGTEPSGAVTIALGGLAAAKTAALVVNPTSLTFTRGNWNVPQPVTVRAAEDDNAASNLGNDAVTLTHSVKGGGYTDAYDEADEQVRLNVVVTIHDNDSNDIVVSTPSLQMGPGTRRTYTVALGSQPTGNVSVAISDPPSGVTVSPDPLPFTTKNWSIPRTVTVHASSNASGSATLEHTASGYNQKDIPLTVKTGANVAVNPTSLTVTEGGSGSYTLVLTSKPTATVNVAVAGAADDVRVNRTRVSFSTGNWDREQTVTVSLAEDDDAVQDAAVTLTHTVTGATEYESATITGTNVTVTLKENDERGVTASPMELTVAAGSSGTYRVRLTSEPLDSVTVTVISPTAGVTVAGPSDGSSLVFTTDNWNTNQTVTVNVAADAGKDTKQSFTLTHEVTGGDYEGLEGPRVALTIPVEGAPSAPTGLTAEAGDQSATLTWGTPSKNGGSAILRYEVRYQEVGGSYSGWATVSGGATATSTIVGNLENGKSYEFQVRARNAVAAGQAATASATLAESAPGAPADLTATPGDKQVALNWGAPADGGSQILRYEYRYAAAGVAYADAWTTVSGAGNARSVTVTGLTNGTVYRFQVRAVNSIGEGGAAEDSTTPGRAPTAPTGLTARVESETIKVMWGVPADTGGAISSYQVRYRMNEGGWISWTTVPGGASATSYTLTGLSNGIGYEIEVAAVNSIGRGAAASVVATPMEGMDFAHFANGVSGDVTMTSDIVLVNVETSTVNPAIYFYDQQGGMLDAATVVDATGELAVNGDGVLTVPLGIRGRGEITISTNGQGPLVVGSVKVFAGGRIGGVLRFDIPNLGVAGVGTSEPVTDAIFPARRVAGGINTGAAIRNLSGGPLTVTCGLMKDGKVLDTELVRLPVDGQSARFIDEMFSGADTSDFTGSVRCLAAEGGTFTGLALEMDFSGGQIFTTLPVVPVDAEAADDGESTLNFAHFANGDGGSPITSDLVFVNVANTAVGPAVYFYDQQGGMINAATLVDAMGGVEVSDSGALTVTDEIPPMGEMTISTNGMGEIVVGSVKVVSDGPIGGVLRFDVPSIGVAGVGASHGFREAIFPARRMAGGINTGAAIRNLGSEATSVTCRLMQDGRRLDEAVIALDGNGQSSRFINEMFTGADTSDFEGSVHCAAPAGSSFTGVALEMDFNNRAFTTLPVIRVR